MLASEIPVPMLVGLAYASDQLALAEVWHDADEAGLTMDLQLVGVGHDPQLLVHLLRGMLVVEEQQIRVKGDLPAVVWLRAAQLHAKSRRLQARVSAAMKANPKL